MTWESRDERDSLADDRDRMWGARPKSGGEIQECEPVSTNQPVETKPCIEGGIPPCPTCPVCEQCHPPGMLTPAEQSRKRYRRQKEGAE